jgi:hypothetical protein
MSGFALPQREGTRPRTTQRTPHTQLEQNSSPEIYEQLAEWAFALPDVVEAPSGVSVPGARALLVSPDVEANERAFMVGREFAHIHPMPYPGSLHLNLMPPDAEEAIQQGWGENHFLVDLGVLPPGTIMVYAPRNDADLAVVETIIARSHAYATNRL